MVIMATSPGVNGGANVLKTANESVPFFSAEIRGDFSGGRFSENFDIATGQLLNPELAQEQREQLRTILSLE